MVRVELRFTVLTRDAQTGALSHEEARMRARARVQIYYIVR